MQTLRNMIFALFALVALALPAAAITVDGGTQTGVFRPNGTVEFDFTGLRSSTGDVLVTVTAWGDLALDRNEDITVLIGALGGPLTSLGTIFGSYEPAQGDSIYGCDRRFACVYGIRDFTLTADQFNGFGTDLTVVLDLGRGVNGFDPNGGQITLAYAAVPLPATLSLSLLSLLGLTIVARRRKRG